jgi:hypothetical protein
LSFPGKRESNCNFPGIPGIPGIDFYLIKLKKCSFLKNKMQYCFTLFDGKYRKCQKNRQIYLINPIPGNPGPISRESRNKKIVGIPGNREREIPGMKHYPWGQFNERTANKKYKAILARLTDCIRERAKKEEEVEEKARAEFLGPRTKIPDGRPVS